MKVVWNTAGQHTNRGQKQQTARTSNSRHSEHSNAYVNSRATRSLLGINSSSTSPPSLSMWRREMHSSSTSPLSLGTGSSSAQTRSTSSFRSYLSDVFTSDRGPTKDKEATSIRQKLELMSLAPGSDTDMKCKRRAETCAICIAVSQSVGKTWG